MSTSVLLKNPSKSPETPSAATFNTIGSIPSCSRIGIRSSEVVEPLTETPSAISIFARGNPSQPVPNMEMCLKFRVMSYELWIFLVVFPSLCRS